MTMGMQEKKETMISVDVRIMKLYKTILLILL